MATKKAPAPVPSKSMLADEKRWQAEDDLRTMQRMAELKANPGRIRAAESLLKQQMTAIKSVKRK
jgi:hypothetical protein